MNKGVIILSIMLTIANIIIYNLLKIYIFVKFVGYTFWILFSFFVPIGNVVIFYYYKYEYTVLTVINFLSGFSGSILLMYSPVPISWLLVYIFGNQVYYFVILCIIVKKIKVELAQSPLSEPLL